MRQHNLYLFVVISLTNILLYLLSSYVLNLDKMFIHSLSEQLTSEQIQKILSIREKWQWVQYALFFNEEIPYKRLFHMALLGESIFLFVPILKLCWFYFFQPDFSLEDLQYFYPLSLSNIIGPKTVATWLIYPLQIANIFEVVYFLFLSIQIDKAIGSTTEKGLNIVGCGYGVGLLLWVVGVMFFTLNMS